MTSTATGQASFHPGKRVRHRANHDARLRKRLQKKGTRGAKRRVRRIEQRERRLKLQANHTLAKQIVEQHPHALIGLEQLTDIRERKKRRRKKNGKGFEPVSVKARKANRVYSQWSFAELQELISYKAALSGSLAVKVDADYTLHADLIGARNVTLRTLLVRQDWARTGTLSLCASCVGQRSQSGTPLQVWLSLRWSPDVSREASLRSLTGGH